MLSFSGTLSGARALSVTAIFGTLLALETAYELLLRHIQITDCLWLAPFNASLYTMVFIAIFRLDLIRLSICYLALPYLIFFPGWLNPPAAITAILIFTYSLYKTLKHNTSIRNDSLHIGELVAFIMILMWVNLAGAGGYGYQTYDYTIHNGRLLDLVNYSWPVHYGPDKNFIYYVGYFLPSALIGKIFGHTAGMRSMFLWAVIGVSIALRWMSVLSGWRFSILLVGAFALFGPLDILGDLYIYAMEKRIDPTIELHKLWPFLNEDTDRLDFWASLRSNFFIGNFLSNTFGLYWSPQQIIAGWIGAGVLTYLFYKERTQHFLFVFSMLSLWAPLIMIAMSPLVIVAACLHIKQKWQRVITLENIIGGGSLVLLLIIFYSAGSVTKNPSYWIYDAGNYDEIALMLLLSWGIYLASLLPLLKVLERHEKVWLGLIAISAAALPLRTYGDYNDLLCRGSAPIMFLILAFFLRNMKQQWKEKRILLTCALTVLFATGTVSALFQIKTAVVRYGNNQPTATIISYPNAYPNLGDDNNFFQKYLARKN
jgi:hypothetical protein